MDNHDASPTERLHSERNVWVATTRPSGRPHLAPVWFVYVDDRLWVGTGADAVRTRNVRHHPQASVALEDGDHPVVAECTVRIHERERPADVVAAFSEKYGWDVTIDVDDDVGEVVLLELVPRRWLFDASLAVVADQ
ncbi:MAG: pyridoxamine 5'-phosphate oxidase family protein [Acidimicrobiales bacterium]